MLSPAAPRSPAPPRLIHYYTNVLKYFIAADESERLEYVMNETGRIWVGSRANHYGRPWVFGQFAACCLTAALHVLDVSELADTAFNNPVRLSRMLSKMSNSFDDDGILVGM